MKQVSFFRFMALWLRCKTHMKTYPSRSVYDRDPLSHPDIARMTEREKADLPFCPERILES